MPPMGQANEKEYQLIMSPLIQEFVAINPADAVKHHCPLIRRPS